jgi:hypothetical protein
MPKFRRWAEHLDYVVVKMLPSGGFLRARVGIKRAGIRKEERARAYESHRNVTEALRRLWIIGLKWIGVAERVTVG